MRPLSIREALRPRGTRGPFLGFYKKISYEELKREVESRVEWRHRQCNMP